MAAAKADKKGVGYRNHPTYGDSDASAQDQARVGSPLGPSLYAFQQFRSFTETSKHNDYNVLE